MIFVNAKNTAEFLQDLLTNKMNRTACILTGNLRDDERDKIIDHFRQGSFPALISTNVLARGIDVPAVDIVINYDIPQLSDCGFRSPDCANYLHRIGRTGRFGTDGIALTFYNPEETRVIDETHFINAIEKEWETEIVELNSFDEFKELFIKMRPMLFQ
jgi:ATP-dependent RNA helicase DDX19/DBP5